MSKEYLAVAGNTSFLLDLDSGEGYAFDDFGSAIEKVEAGYAISVCKSMIDVDIISILGSVSTNVCEIYFKGERILVRDKIMSVYSKLFKVLPTKSSIVYRISRKVYPGVYQILLPLEKDKVSVDMLKVKLYPESI